ncbi:MAG: response regulator, partial [Hyphomicrobium sp.]
MTARVLVVDDILANIRLLQARLEAEYFEVVTATSGQQALDICGRERVDVVLLDVMMPGMDGFEVCRRIKANASTLHIPVVMVTALDQPSDRVQGLEYGADDFLTKPVDDIALVTRVKSLARLKMLNDEMLMRAVTSRQLGLGDEDMLREALADRPGRVLVVDDHPRSSSRVMSALARVHEAFIEPDPQAAL